MGLNILVVKSAEYAHLLGEEINRSANTFYWRSVIPFWLILPGGFITLAFSLSA